MYKAIIVDDEKMIRNGIHQIIPWKEIGIDEVFTAASGKEAYQLIEAERPNILLTDICMSELNGLGLIERVNQFDPEIRIIVLTGYDKFEYVQQCCKMNVKDFILKPVDKQELTVSIKNQVQELDRGRNIRHQERLMNRTKGLAEQMKLEQAMRYLIHNRKEAGEAITLVKEYHYQEDQRLQVAMLVPVLYENVDWKGHSELLSLSIKKICMELFDSNLEGITFEDEEARIIIAIFVDNRFDETYERVERLILRIKDEYGISPKIFLGSVVKGYDEISTSYHDACYLLSAFEEDTNEIIQSNRTERRLKMFHDTFNELKRVMVNHIGDIDYIMKVFHTFEKATVSYNLSDSLVRRNCFDIASALYFTYLSEIGESVDNKLNSLLTSLMNSTGEEACRYTCEFLHQLFYSKDESLHEVIRNAKHYIKDHLSDDLTVSDLATHFFVTPNYFSRLFKNATGEGCNEYIVRKRIEKAKSLLETTGFKTGKIAGMVGYNDTNYFSLAFKKYTGLSPTAYRDGRKIAN